MNIYNGYAREHIRGKYLCMFCNSVETSSLYISAVGFWIPWHFKCYVLNLIGSSLDRSWYPKVDKEYHKLFAHEVIN